MKGPLEHRKESIQQNKFKALLEPQKRIDTAELIERTTRTQEITDTAE